MNLPRDERDIHGAKNRLSPRLQLNLTRSDDSIARLLPISFPQRRRHPLPRLIQSFRQNPRLAYDRHEVSVGNPAG